MDRLSWDDYFISMALLASKRATCERLRVGTIIVRDNQIIATGYNGSASGDVHCIDVGCLMEDDHCVRTIHSEQNALLQCAKHGVSTNGATVYVTHFPCFNCAKTLVTAGIKELIYLDDYHNSMKAILLLEDSGVNVSKLVRKGDKK